MRSRIYIAVLLSSLVALALIGDGTASAAKLGKPDARKAAVAKMNRYLASHPWAEVGAVKECERRAKVKVVCAVVFQGGARKCTTRIKVLRQGKGRRARLGKLRCAKSQQVTPAPSARIMRLSAYIDRSPTRNQADPFEVTYSYGAAATQQIAGSAPEPSVPPAGVLALYNNGLLKCADNVTGENAAADCPVDYSQLGAHSVTTIYTSGSESAADTMTYTVSPLSTTTTIEATYTPGDAEDLEGGKLGTLVLTTGADPVGTTAFGCTGQDPTGCIDYVPYNLNGCCQAHTGYAPILDGPVTFTVFYREQCADLEVSVRDPAGNAIALGAGVSWIGESGRWFRWEDVRGDLESGERFLQARTSVPAGYEPSSATAPLTLSIDPPACSD